METVDGAGDRESTIDISSDTRSVEDEDSKPGAAAKIQRSGSRWLSVVGIQTRGSGKCLALLEL